MFNIWVLQPQFDCQQPSILEVCSNFLSASEVITYSIFQNTFSKVVKSKIGKPSHVMQCNLGGKQQNYSQL